MIHVEVADGVATITLDRAEKLNALDRRFWLDLPAALRRIEAAGDIRAAVLRGAGKRAFCAGGDIAGFAALDTDRERRAYQIEAMDAFLALEQAPVPIIAAVHGFALGGGCELVLACDMAIASVGAVFGLPEVALGLVPGYGAIRAPAIVGHRMARLMIHAGERLDAQAALSCGLVQAVFPEERLFIEAHRIATAIAAGPATAIAAARRLIDRPSDPSLVARSIEEIAALHATPEAQGAVAGFVRKRG